MLPTARPGATWTHSASTGDGSHGRVAADPQPRLSPQPGPADEYGEPVIGAPPRIHEELLKLGIEIADEA